MLAERFSTIVKKERVDELIPFLKSLEKDDKKEMASVLKPLAKEYLEYRHVSSLMGPSTYKQKATPVQVSMLYAAAFTCLNRKDYQKYDTFNQIVNNQFLRDILSWYCPDWFSDLINDLTKREWMPWDFKYSHAMEMADRGYLNPTDELIVRLIPQMIFEQGPDYKYSFVPQNLEERPITLEKHIWLIFQFETTIHFSDRYRSFQNANKESDWKTALKHCSANGRLDRQRLLKESLLATCRNFNKALSGWFVDLFEFMQPLKQELLLLQPELLNAMSSQHSKAVNAALRAIKDIVAENEFNIAGFLENAPLLLSSDTKSVVSSTLLLFEKILRRNPSFGDEICIAACQAFIHNDEAIQNKACKILLKYYDGSPGPVTEEISKYNESMLMSSRNVLSSVIHSSQPLQEIVSSDTSMESGIHPVQEITSLDDLIFLASQAFDNNDPLHIDLLPAALVNMQGQLKGSILHKFEPALQRAYSFVMNDWTSTMGYLDHLLATFFIDFTWLLIHRFPKESSSLEQIHATFKTKDEENKAKWSWYSSRILELTTWSVASKDTTYMIHKAILLLAYEKLKVKEELPILSTPTHEGGYIDPSVLVRRLLLYENNGVSPDSYDFQLAISRVASFNHSQAVKLGRETLKGEVLKIIEFLLNKNANPTPPFVTASLWFMAGVTKSPHQNYPEFNPLFYSTLPRSIFTGDFSWRSTVEHFKVTRYNFQTKANEEVPSQHNVLRLVLPSSPSIWQEAPERKEGIFSKLSSLFSAPGKSKREEAYLLYEFLSLKAKFLSAEQNDIQRFVFLFPSNPNPVLALVASKSLQHSTFSSETDKKIVTKALEALINLKFHFTEMTHLFIASCMLTSDKTVRSFAAEMWSKAVSCGQIASEQVGKIIGVHLSNGYAPMKRFTDLVPSHLLKISQVHNAAMERMLGAIIENLAPEPPVGTKRFLEIYSEILLLNGSVPSDKVQQMLSSWASSPGLRKAILSLGIKTSG